jgi:hypothetical protein
MEAGATPDLHLVSRVHPQRAGHISSGFVPATFAGMPGMQLLPEHTEERRAASVESSGLRKVSSIVLIKLNLNFF